MKGAKRECDLAMWVADVLEHLGGGVTVCAKLTLSKIDLEGGW